MAAIATSQQRSVRASNVQDVVVPNHDVCRLSFYLHSCTLSCGIDIIVDELVDYKNVHKLPQARQEVVFKLAAESFSVSEMLDKTIFLDESGQLCGNKENMFFEIRKVTNVLAVSSSALLGGKQVQISTIMVFKPVWLEKFYLQPVKRWKEQKQTEQEAAVRRFAKLILGEVTETVSKHCVHCRGLGGSCGCDHGCLPKESTECSAAGHCKHCKGIESGACSCEFDCRRGQTAKCFIVHTSVTCDACRAVGLRGSRFKCEECFDYDLCEKCYRGDRHELTHSFSKIERVGSNRIHLPPRQQKVVLEPEVDDVREPNANRPIPLPNTRIEADSRQANAAANASKKRPVTFVGEHMSISQMKEYLNENGVSYRGVREREELLKLVWETQIESMGAAELDAFIHEHGIRCSEGRSVSAKRKAAVAAFDVIPREKGAAKSYDAFRNGDVVQLHGLKKNSMNGMLATVVRSELANGRLQVQPVDDANHRYNILAKNLRAVAQDLD
ncbi:E3 ubiquitin-protein ligase MIB2 [Gracilaria domingensis]|nr:E3 ubiquitin-protein ligase MIB2 [Gracilaria domingensis]